MDLRLRLKELDEQRRKIREELGFLEMKMLAVKSTRKENQTLTVTE